MLLRYCPVGSEVRLASFRGKTDHGMDFWQGSFIVFERDGVKCVKDGDGDIRYDISFDVKYQFEIVSQPTATHNHARQITLDGVTFKLTLAGKRETIEIDGVVYEMEPV